MLVFDVRQFHALAPILRPLDDALPPEEEDDDGDEHGEDDEAEEGGDDAEGDRVVVPLEGVGTELRGRGGEYVGFGVRVGVGVVGEAPPGGYLWVDL